MQVIDFESVKRVPFITQVIYIDLNGHMTNEFGTTITIDEFNLRTGLCVLNAVVLRSIVFSVIKMPPVYWKHLKAMMTIPGVDAPESMTLAPLSPIESLEQPGFYLIPYFSNYLISRDGVLYKRSEGLEIKASRTSLGYYTYRLTGDNGSTSNQLRHRILCLTFKEYGPNVDTLDVNHIDGIPGNDFLENLEWCTRSENMIHAYNLGLRSDNKPVEILEINTGRIFRYASCSMAAQALKLCHTTVGNRAKTNGYKVFDGFQFRFHPCEEEWPIIEDSDGQYVVVFPDGSEKKCSCIEAARLVGLTRTSLLRALREGRDYGTNSNKIYRVQK